MNSQFKSSASSISLSSGICRITTIMSVAIPRRKQMRLAGCVYEEKLALPVKMLNMVARVNPVAGIENKKDSKYMSGSIAHP